MAAPYTFPARLENPNADFLVLVSVRILFPGMVNRRFAGLPIRCAPCALPGGVPGVAAGDRKRFRPMSRKITVLFQLSDADGAPALCRCQGSTALDTSSLPELGRGMVFPRERGPDTFPTVVDIRELARRSGVSQATVSRALNDRTEVSTETRRRILELAEELGYTPNQPARTLVRRRSDMIGLIWDTGYANEGRRPAFLLDLFVGHQADAGRERPPSDAAVHRRRRRAWTCTCGPPGSTAWTASS